MKTIRVKPVESIKIELEDRSFIFSFNMKAMAYLNEELAKLESRVDELSSAHLSALILYGGIKANDEDFTVGDANALALQLGPSTYTYWLTEFSNAIYDSADPEQKALLKKAMAQYLKDATK